MPNTLNIVNIIWLIQTVTGTNYWAPLTKFGIDKGNLNSEITKECKKLKKKVRKKFSLMHTVLFIF